MSHYLLSVWHVGDYPDATTPEAQEMFARTGVFNDELQAAGSWVFAGGLHPRETATTIDATGGGAPVVTDGPYAESKEQMGGFWIIDVPDIDSAMDWAARGSAACGAPVEVRPFQGE